MVGVASLELLNNESTEDMKSYLLLHVGEELYLVQGLYVREISRWRTPLPVPGAANVLPGIISQRGIVLPVINLHALFGLPEVAPGRATRFVITHHDEVDMALVVDAVTDLTTIADDQFEAVPSTLDPQRGRFLQAIARVDDQPAALIDLQAVTNHLRSGV
jgi:purine-binding chemotaxis protein CheW